MDTEEGCMRCSMYERCRILGFEYCDKYMLNGRLIFKREDDDRQ